MARPREFDIEVVLKQSMHVFWIKGYKATSLEDLMKATQLNKQSFYCAFGDKRSLFLKILELYRNQRLETLQTNLNLGDSPLEAIRQVLTASILRPAGDERPPGCLFISTTLEFGVFDPEITAEVNKMFEGFEQLLVEVIQRGQEMGEITSRFPSRIIAKTVLNTLMGLRVLEKRGTSLPDIEAVLNMSLEGIRS